MSDLGLLFGILSAALAICATLYDVSGNHDRDGEQFGAISLIFFVVAVVLCIIGALP